MRSVLLIVMLSIISCKTGNRNRISTSDIEMQLEELQSANAYANSKLEELNNRLYALQEDSEANRIKLLDVKKSKAAKDMVVEKKDNKKVEKKVQSASTTNIRAVYNSGLSLFKKKRYSSAATKFSVVLKNSPRSKYAPDSLYWLGEVNFEKGLYQKAIQTFKRIPEEYPLSNKIDSAILKIAFCHLKLGKKDKAIARFKEIINIYPNSDSAMIAKKQLGGLK